MGVVALDSSLSVLYDPSSLRAKSAGIRIMIVRIRRHLEDIVCGEEGSPTLLQLLTNERSGQNHTQRVKVKRRTSKKMNIKTVLGPKRMKAGVHPLNKKRGPSSRSAVVRTSTGCVLPCCEGLVRAVA